MKKIEIENKLLIKFIQDSQKHLNNIDMLMKNPDNNKRSEAIAREMNNFNFNFHSFLHFACDVPLEKLQSSLNKSFKL